MRRLSVKLQPILLLNESSLLKRFCNWLSPKNPFRKKKNSRVAINQIWYTIAVLMQWISSIFQRISGNSLHQKIFSLKTLNKLHDDSQRISNTKISNTILVKNISQGIFFTSRPTSSQMLEIFSQHLIWVEPYNLVLTRLASIWYLSRYWY